MNVERSIEATDDVHWDTHLNVILRASFLTVQAALPLLKAGRGCIVNVASELGLHAIANNVAYVSAKHGLVAMTKAWPSAGARRRRANALCPGTMDTELMRDCATDSGDPEARTRPSTVIIRSDGWPRPTIEGASVPALAGGRVHDRIRGRDRWRQHRRTVKAMGSPARHPDTGSRHRRGGGGTFLSAAGGDPARPKSTAVGRLLGDCRRNPTACRAAVDRPIAACRALAQRSM